MNFIPTAGFSVSCAKKAVPLLPLAALLLLSSCAGKIVSETEAKPASPPAEKPATTLPAWLGNSSRNFYGTGPWSADPLEVVWSFETTGISGRLHKDPWGGSSWPGQPSVDERHVYFGSADGRLYCLDVRDGSLVWRFQTEDSLKATPTIVGDRLIASGLDHYIYCINKNDGSLIWKFKTGFEVDCSSAVIDGRVYFGGEDGFFYCLNLEDGTLVYKTEWLGSMEGSFSAVGRRIYIGTEQGSLFCLNMADGSTIWKARIGADSDSTPAVANGLVYTAAENGFVYCFRQTDGEPVWKFRAARATGRNHDERTGFWASPIVANGRVHIGSSNGTMYCLTADKGEVVWQFKAHGAIWGTAPLVDGRLVFGDKAG